MKKIDKRDIITFFIILIFALILFAGYLTPHFATDTYRVYDRTYTGYSKENSLLDGRLIQFTILNILNFFNVPIHIATIILTILALIVSSVSVLVLKKWVEKYKKFESITGQIFLTLVCFFTIFNFMYLENMYFLECLVMAFSVLLYIVSAKCIIEKGKFYFLKSMILMILAIICYQGTISCFFITVLVFSILKEKELKGIIKNIGISIGIGLIGVALNIIIVHLAENFLNLVQNRDFALNKILKNLSYILEQFTVVLVFTGHLFYDYIFIIILLVLELLLIVKSVIKKDFKTNRILLEQFIILICGIGFAFIVSAYNLDGFWSGRIRFSIGATIGFLMLHLIVKTDLLEKNNIINILLKIVFIIYAVLICSCIVTNIETVKTVNKLDKEKSLEIGRYIEEYEENSGKTVENLAIIVEGGKTSLAYYPDLWYHGSITTCSAARTEWAVTGVINYYNNLKLTEKEPTKQEIEQYRKNVDDKKYMCMDDTLYISCYMY